jgi:calcium/calmodulin-dependent protein kinase I
LKPENILFHSKNDGEYDMRIADLGLAKKITDSEALSIACGTPGFIAPEVLEGSTFNFRAECYAIGAIMYNLITGESLFEANSIQELIDINRVSYIRPKLHLLQKKITFNCFTLLVGLLRKEPMERTTIKGALSSPWFNDIREALNLSLHLNEQNLKQEKIN